MHREDFPFRVIRVNSENEVIARANDLIVGRAAYKTARRLYPSDLIQYQDGARIIAAGRAESVMTLARTCHVSTRGAHINIS